MRKRLRMWRLDRRIKRLLHEAGMPPVSRSIFTGNVQLHEVVYDHAACAAWYVKHYEEPS